MSPSQTLHLRAFPRVLHLYVWLTFGLLTAGLVVVFYVYRDTPVWDSFIPSNKQFKSSYSETIIVNSVFRTRANTWSNLAYVLVGLYAMALAWWDYRRGTETPAPYVVRQPALAFLFGIACCYLGVGSGIYHASLTRWGQQLDVGAMYSPLVVLISIHWARWLPSISWHRRTIPTWPVFGAIAVVTSALLYVYKWELSSKRVMMILILLIGVGGLLDAVTRRFAPQQRWIFLGLISLVAAYACRQLDVAGRFTGPEAWLQGHALWHVLTAASLGWMVLFYRSERVRDTVAIRTSGTVVRQGT